MQRLFLAVVLTLSALGVAAPATFAAGNTIVVNTTADGEFPGDGKCSLMAAIKAANTGASAGYCVTAGTAGLDVIHFNLGGNLPTITLSADLPPITDPVTIDAGGGFNVRITSSGLTTGLEIDAGQTTIRGLVIDGFITGIHVNGATGVTIIGNKVGPNSDAGILADNAVSNLTIGSNAGQAPGDDCNDDCNLISGNARVGIEVHGSGEIVANYLGTTKGGLNANPNGVGAIVADGEWTVGGRTIPDRNVISGNTGAGLELIECVCTVQGNYIGLGINGLPGPGNGGDGVDLVRPYTTSIGGPLQGSRNLISGNGGNGINVDTDLRHDGAVLTIMQNKIGVSTSNTAAGNSGDGIYLGAFAPRTIIGSMAPNTSNLIARNGGAGVRVADADDTGIEVRANQITSNVASGIAIQSGANNSIAAPVITGVSPVHGTACGSCAVDIYSDKEDEGKNYLGSVTADSAGHWTFSGDVFGANLTATNTDANHNTSEFSAAVPLNGGGGGGGGTHQPDGRINKFSGGYVGNDIYNADGTNQSKSGVAKVGYIVEFHLSLQNDGDSADTFKLSVNAGSTTMYRLKFYRGSNDITTAVIAGTYTTPSVAPGGKLVITIDVVVKKGATANSTVSRLLTATAVGDSAQADTVGFTAGRK